MARRSAFPTRQRRTIALAACFLLALAPIQLLGHPEFEEQIALLTLALQKEPANVNLWLHRSDLQRQHRQFDLALADLDQAARLRPGWATLSLARARTLFDAERTRDALAATEAFLKSEPDHAEGLLLQARCLSRLGQMDKAAAAYTSALKRFAEPSPDLFLERARLQAALGRLQGAVEGLDEGISRLGPVPALELSTIEYERQRGDFDAAFSRAGSLVLRAGVKEPALALRAELLEQTGRFVEARDTFQQLVRRIDAYPANRRTIEATLQLQRRAQEGSARVAAKLSRSASQGQSRGMKPPSGTNP